MDLRPLRQYQERAIEEARSSSRYEAIGMGLGKTRIMLELLASNREKALVVAPLRVCKYTWPEEIDIWAPQLSHTFLWGPNKELLLTSNKATDVMLIGYDTLKWLYGHIASHGSDGIKGRTLILDEATQIKNPSSVRFKALKAMQHFFPKAYCMSGTPLPNGMIDLWSQYYMLDRGRRLGKNITAYKSKYFIVSGPPRWQCDLIPGKDVEIIEAVRDITTVLRSEDYLEIPPRTDINIPVELPKQAMDMYREFKKELVLELQGETIQAMTAASRDSKLKQILQGGIYAG